MYTHNMSIVHKEQVKNCLLSYIGINDLVNLVVEFVDPLLLILSMTGPDELMTLQHQETQELVELQTLLKKGMLGQPFNSINDLIVVEITRSFQKVTIDRMQCHLIDQGWRVIVGSSRWRMEYWILVDPKRTQPVTTREILKKLYKDRFIDRWGNDVGEIQWSSPVD